MNLAFKYRFLLPFLARFPQKIAYRLASLTGRFSLAEHALEKKTIIEQMQTVFTEKSKAELVASAEYFFSMVEREALDSFFFAPVKQRSKSINLFS